MATYYISPSGNDSTGNGTIGSPWKTFNKANSSVSAGDTVYVRGGTYDAGSSAETAEGGYYKIQLSTSGTAGNPITWTNYSNETAVLDHSSVPVDTVGNYWNTRPATLNISGNYITVDGLDVQNSPAEGIELSGSTNGGQHHAVIRNCYVKHTYGPGINTWNSQYYTIENNIVYDCYDYGATLGGDADGIHLNQDAPGVDGNGVIRGNIILFASDDGVDGWGQGHNLIENNFTYKCGYQAASPSSVAGDGNGNGFKIGGNGTHDGYNTLRFNVAASMRSRGFTTNDCTNNIINNCTAYDSGGVGFLIAYATDSCTIQNCIAYNNAGGNWVDNGSATVHDHNTWDLAIANPSFASTTAPTGDPPLPSADYLHLTSGSSCRGAGTTVTATTNSEPASSNLDLGAYPFAVYVALSGWRF